MGKAIRDRQKNILEGMEVSENIMYSGHDSQLHIKRKQYTYIGVAKII